MTAAQSPLDPDQARRGARPLSELPPGAWRSVLGLMTDIDDTLTRDGLIEPAALAALQQLAVAGVPVVAITGRPLGWCRELTGDWPLAAVVAENGAVARVRDADCGTIRTEYAQDAATRESNALRLRAAAARVLAEQPGTQLARDSAGRETDIAIDHGEFTRLPAAAIEQVVAILQGQGLTATVSSIHINAWFGDHSKLSGARWMLRRLFGRELDAERDRWVYVGDSTNDQALFGHFPQAVGVANLMAFAHSLHTWPAWMTAGERGVGFAEVVARLLHDREHARPQRGAV
ncbi:MAG: HAD-IIB family hydrolase [Rubrivivax sp.]|jgi:hypothetical protein